MGKRVAWSIIGFIGGVAGAVYLAGSIALLAQQTERPGIVAITQSTPRAI